MDTGKILKADYLDILFEGKNKQYGGYELRKQYNKRALTAFGISIAIIAVLVSFHFISFAEKNSDLNIPPLYDSVIIVNKRPPEEKILPPAKVEPVEAKPAPPTDMYKPPIVAKNSEVQETDVIQHTPTDNVPGPETNIGELGNPGDFNPGLNGKGKGGIVYDGDSESGEEVRVSVDRLPTPTVNLKEFIEKNLKYPLVAKVNEIEGKVNLQFVVEKDGSISNIEAVGRKLGGGLEEEAIRIMKKVPPYIPGELNGKPVRVKYFQVVFFKISR